MASCFQRLVALLEHLEDTLTYVTVDDVCARWEPAAEAAACRALVDAAIADRRLFTDRRERYDADSGRFQPVRLVRLNRRHPEVSALLS